MWPGEPILRDYDFVPYKSYHMMPEPALTAMARGYLFDFSEINDPHLGGYRTSATSLPPNSRSCVVAEKGRLSLNFGSSVIQGWAMASLMDVEGIVAEGRRNISLDPEIPPSTVAVYDGLERETRVFLDHLTGNMALNVRDVIQSSLQAGVNLHLVPV